jgi:hypothetical protein
MNKLDLAYFPRVSANIIIIHVSDKSKNTVVKYVFG